MPIKGICEFFMGFGSDSKFGIGFQISNDKENKIF